MLVLSFCMDDATELLVSPIGQPVAQLSHTVLGTKFVALPADLRVFTFRQEQDGSVPRELLNANMSHFLGHFYTLITIPKQYGRAASDGQCRSDISQRWHSLREFFLGQRTEPRATVIVEAAVLFSSSSSAAPTNEQSSKQYQTLLKRISIDEFWDALPSALIWCLTIGARYSVPGTNTRRLLLMQLTRVV